MADLFVGGRLRQGLQDEKLAIAEEIEVDGANNTGILANAGNVEAALERLDSTGIGAQARTFTGSFFAIWSSEENRNIWYGGRQTVALETDRSQTNGRYTFTVPDPDDLALMFDDLAARGLGEIYTLRLTHRAGSSSSVVRNALTVTVPTVSVGFPAGTFPTTIGQGVSATFRIERINGVIQNWERVSVEQSVDPVATFGEVVLQNTGWNNNNNSFLPSGAAVQKGFAFPVVGSNPNDGTLRQGLLDSGVSDRIIYDGDYVVWTADAFTSWANGNDWFVLNRNDLQRMSQEQSNFLSQVNEIDSRVDVAPVESLANDALVWLSENPLAAAPFLTPSTDTNNPRSGDDYPYIGGRENRTAQQLFQFGQNRSNSYLTLGITPSFISGQNNADIFVYLRDVDGAIIETLNLDSDFVARTDGDFTNSTVAHFTRNSTFDYPFLATVEVWLTQVQRHFTVNPLAVDLTPNIESLPENQLSADVQDKLNRAIPPAGVSYDDIESRLSPLVEYSTDTPTHEALFLDSTGTDPVPSDLSTFAQVSADNPRYPLGAGNTAVFIAVIGSSARAYALNNLTSDTVTPLEDGQSGVDILESTRYQDQTWFVYRVTGLTAGDLLEVESVTRSTEPGWPHDINNNSEAIARIDAELSHAALNLPDSVVQVLEHEITVTEEDSPTVVSTEFNNQLAGASNTTQTVFYESSPNTGSGGVLASKPIADTSGTDRARQKLVYLPAGLTYNNQAYLTAFDGTTGRDLIRYRNGVFSAQVFVAAKSAGSSTETIYPAPSNKVSGSGVWINIPALTFVNGAPTPLADEVFFTRNIPASSTTLTIQYRGHANGNVFGTSSTTLAGVGGSSDAFANFSLNDGGESASVEVRWDASARNIRVSVTERVNAGLPTISDIEVILSFDEVRTIPATPATVREVDLEFEHPGGQVFAIKASAAGNLILVGDRAEVDTNYSYITLFGASETGHLIAGSEQATFLDYEDFSPITTTIADLENHSTLPQLGLFTTQYTHETITALGTQLTVLDDDGTAHNVGNAAGLIDDQSASAFIDIGNTRIQWGQSSGGSAVTLPAAFSDSNYTVTANSEDVSNSFFVAIGSKTATGFTGTVRSFSGGTSSSNYRWMAIGLIS